MDCACVLTLPSLLVFSLLFPYISKHFSVLLPSMLIWHIGVYTDLNKWIRGTKTHTEWGMTRNSFIGRWKGHCYCPTSPPSSRGVSTAHGDYRRRKNPLNTFCFVFLSFLLLLFAQRWTYEREKLLRKWDFCLSVALRYWQAVTSKATMALWSGAWRETSGVFLVWFCFFFFPLVLIIVQHTDT